MGKALVPEGPTLFGHLGHPTAGISYSIVHSTPPGPINFQIDCRLNQIWCWFVYKWLAPTLSTSSTAMLKKAERIGKELRCALRVV